MIRKRMGTEASGRGIDREVPKSTANSGFFIGISGFVDIPDYQRDVRCKMPRSDD
jgi:hypothetical protein